jgi:hypothetical protein
MNLVGRPTSEPNIYIYIALHAQKNYGRPIIFQQKGLELIWHLLQNRLTTLEVANRYIEALGIDKPREKRAKSSIFRITG